MERLKFLAIGVLVLGLIFLGAGQALADDCALLGGNIVGTECQITGAAPGTPPNSHSGTFTIGETLRITGTGIITVPQATTLAVNVTGDFIMEIGGEINGDGDNTHTAATINITVSGQIILQGNGTDGGLISAETHGQCSGGHGGVINLTSNFKPTAPDVSIDIQAGAKVSVDGVGGTPCPAGAITILALNDGSINIDGTVTAGVDTGSTGTGNRTDGGTITIKAGCSLNESKGGLISSRGRDNGADLVYLQGGCEVKILGKVESTAPAGGGHTGSTNHCNADDVNAHPLLPSTGEFEACVQIVSGGTVLIDGPSGGEVNADGIQAPNRAWIDILAVGDITITGDTSVPYAVHANGHTTNDTFGGVITVKSKTGKVTASNLAIQAISGSNSSLSNGGTGGRIDVEALGTVTLDTAFLDAHGDLFGGTPCPYGQGACGDGGHIIVKAWGTGSDISWKGGDGNVQPNTTGSGTVGGDIALTACDTIDITSVPPQFHGEVPSTTTGVCDDTNPDIPVTLPTCPATCFCTGKITIKKTCDVFNSSLSFTYTDDIVSPFTFNLPCSGTQQFTGLASPHDYSVTETIPSPPPSWTFGGIQCTPTDGKSTFEAKGDTGVTIHLAACEEVECTFTNTNTGVPPPTCKEDPGRAAYLTRTVDTSKVAPGPGTGNPGSPINYLKVQDAYNAAKLSPGTKDEVIGLFSKTNENVVLDNYSAKSMTLTQCTSAQVTAVSAAPVWDITANKKILIISPDAVGGTIGWFVETNGHELKSIRANGASQYGVLITGSNNAVSFNGVGDKSPNGVGMRVDGTGNNLKSGTFANNNGDGVQIFGNTNSFQGATVQGNVGNGVAIKGTGSGNTIKSNKASKNGGAGFLTESVVPKNNFGSNAASTNGGSEWNFGKPQTATDTNNSSNGVKIPTATKCKTLFSNGGTCE